MLEFISASVIASLMILLTCLITYEVMRLIWKKIPQFNMSPHFRVLAIIMPVFLVHIVNIWLYAGMYMLLDGRLGGLTYVVADDFVAESELVKYLYYSAITYSSLGFGDVVPYGDIQMITGAQVLNGLILIAWTASFTYLAMEKFWDLPHIRGRKAKKD